MRTLFAFCLLCVVLTACKTEVKEKKEGYTITGEAPGIYNGVRAYLESVDERGRKIALDTAIIMNEKFSFEGKVEYPKMLNLSINSVQGSVPIILENEDLSIAINKDNLSGSEIKGSKANQALIAYNKKTIELSNKQRELNRALRQVSQRDNVIATDSDASAKALKDVNTKLENYPFQFIDEHKDNVFSLVLLENLLKNNQVDINTIETAFSSLDDDLKNSMQGTMTHTKIKIVKAERDAVGATEIGKIAPAFSAPTPEGQPLALNDIKGKVTLIDFWASWCQPCRRENPNVVKVYEKYHDKGLEIISVSLDGSRTQRDPKAAWIKAIKDDKLTWHHVSNLNYFNDPVAKSYNIRSIPATFILDEEGKIIAKNLRGPALENKIAELLN